MRRLRVVGLGDDDETVILEDPIRHERFAVPGDERLRAAARGDVRRLGQMEIDSATPLRPRDIQARIRAGETVEQVAAHGGVTHAHVERFAYPVLLERARVAEIAGAARPRVEGGAEADGEVRTLRESVTITLAARGQDHDDPRWDAWKSEDGEWVVGLAWRAGRTDNLAHWTYRPGPSGGMIAARDDPARELLGQAPVGGPRRVGESRQDGEPAEPAVEEGVEVVEGVEQDDEVPSAATATGEVAPRAGAARREAGGASGAATARRPSTRGADARRSRAGREVPDQRTETASTASTASSASTPSRSRGGARTAGGATGRTAGGGAAPEDGADGADARGRSRRHPIVPSWEDVLLGVRSPRE